MISSKEIVLVAVSGGTDSLALLHSLNNLQSQLGCHLHVAHLNHGLRSNAAKDTTYVCQQAQSLDLPVTIREVSLPNSSEASARQARYQFFEQVSNQIGASKIALGHHLGDQAETVLMRLFRGSGITGLRGMLKVRDGKFIRPLLTSSRTEIEEFTHSLGLTPCHDESNMDRGYLRNRIRIDLMPHLKENYNPNIQEALNRMAEILQGESDFLDTIATTAFDACKIGANILDRDNFLNQHPAIQRRILRLAMIEQLGCTADLYYKHFESMIDLINGHLPNGRLHLPNGLVFSRAYNQLVLDQSPIQTDEFQYEVTVPNVTDLPAIHGKISTSVRSNLPSSYPDGKFEAVFDWDISQFPLYVRNRRDGDCFQPFGMAGQKKIKDLLIDAKVPQSERDRLPLLVCEAQIMWVIGYRTSDLFRISKRTKRVLHVTYENLNQ